MDLTFSVRCYESVGSYGNTGVGRGACVEQGWCLPDFAPGVDAVVSAQGRVSVIANNSSYESHLARRISR